MSQLKAALATLDVDLDDLEESIEWNNTQDWLSKLVDDKRQKSMSYRGMLGILSKSDCCIGSQDDLEESI